MSLSAAEAYAWNCQTFGVGIAQNYALVVVEETAELHAVIAKRASGDLAPWSRFKAALGSEIGDVTITALVMGGFEGLDMAEAVAEIAESGEHLAFAGVGPGQLADRLVAEAGRVARAVLKRDQGIRESPEFWRGEIGEALAALVYGASCLAPWFDLIADDAITSRWADVSGRDWSAHRPPGEPDQPGSSGEPHVTRETVQVAGYRPEPEADGRTECERRWPECHVDGYDPRCCRFPKSCSPDLSPRVSPRDASLDPEPDRGAEDSVDDSAEDHCPACDAGVPDGHTCALQVTPPEVRQAVAGNEQRDQVRAWVQAGIDEQRAADPSVTPEVAMERAARAVSGSALPRCREGRPGCRNRISREVVAEAPESDEARRCAHCRADGAKVGDAVMVNAAVEVTHCSRWWPGHVAQVGPAAAVHDLAALEDGDVRVVLTPQTWGDGEARPLPGGGVVIVKRELRAFTLAVDDGAARAARERAQAGLASLTARSWEGVEHPVARVELGPIQGGHTEQDGVPRGPHGLPVHGWPYGQAQQRGQR